MNTSPPLPPLPTTAVHGWDTIAMSGTSHSVVVFSCLQLPKPKHASPQSNLSLLAVYEVSLGFKFKVQANSAVGSEKIILSVGLLAPGVKGTRLIKWCHNYVIFDWFVQSSF